MERRQLDLRRQRVAGPLEWRPVPLARIAPSMQRAVVVAEDARFWKHEGVDWEAVRRALEEDLDEGGVRRGASTITQQLAKNLYLSSSRSPWRKLREWAIARKLERELTKQRILELYLNVIEFGERTYGVEAAARRYFGKPASRLTPREAATLAAVIPSPRIYDPVRHPRRVARRANEILRWMGTWRKYPEASVGASAPTPEPSLPPIPGVAQEAPTPPETMEAPPEVTEDATPAPAQPGETLTPLIPR